MAMTVDHLLRGLDLDDPADRERARLRLLALLDRLEARIVHRDPINRDAWDLACAFAAAVEQVGGLGLESDDTEERDDR